MKAKDSSCQMIVRLMFRLVYNMAKNVQYQSVLGLNVLTITI